MAGLAAGSTRSLLTLHVFWRASHAAAAKPEVIKDWPGKTDSEIASEIFDKYSLDTEVESTDVTHDDTVSTIIQRGVDVPLPRQAPLGAFARAARPIPARAQILNGILQPDLMLLEKPIQLIAGFDAK